MKYSATVTVVALLIAGALFLGLYQLSRSKMEANRMNTAATLIEEQENSGKKSNRLIHEKSPYLLQHAFNPVDWYPWGEEAFEKALKEDKPIFLSVGYSTCYWCHVMEREVFENPSIAKLMNEYFVNIKVDREERPDVDRVYMAALQGLTGSGGWPMSLFLTPHLKPFYAATYIPPVAQYGRMGFPDLANRIHELWQADRKKILESSEQVFETLRRGNASDAARTVGEEVLRIGFRQLLQQHDSLYGGFGGAPKFPRPVVLNFLLRYYDRTGEKQALEMSLTTLRKMAEGGMYDHLGAGFHRYSVDARWRVPHFEKMLYDQAQLVNSYLEAYQISHDEFYAAVARDVLDYVMRRMTSGEGGFYSAEDAESAIDRPKSDEKEEGAFYLWKKSEIKSILGNELGEIFSFCYGVTEAGNTIADPHGVFGDRNVLYAAHTIEESAAKYDKSVGEIRELLQAARKKLFQAREARSHPHRDDKILTSWNGLMISAFARAYQVLDDPRFVKTAREAAAFVTTRLYDSSRKRLLHRFRDGDARFDADLQDYAFLIMGLLDLYEGSFEVAWLEKAVALTMEQNEIFFDRKDGGFWDTSGKEKSILVRTKEKYDGAEPAGNSIAVLNLLRLSEITNNRRWRDMAEKTLKVFGNQLQNSPLAMPQMLVAVDFHLTKPKEIIIAGKTEHADTKALLRQVHQRYLPKKVLLLADGDLGQRTLASYNAYFEGVAMRDGKATAYVCEDYVCRLPTTDAATLAQQLGEYKKGISRK